jgi:hypothetical protein
MLEDIIAFFILPLLTVAALLIVALGKPPQP